MTTSKKSSARKSTSQKVTSAFHDLGLPNADALVLRSNLMRAVRKIIKTFSGNREAVAARVGLTLQRTSALLDGKLSRFSAEDLVSVILKLGQDVEISVTNSHPPHAVGTLKIRLGDRKIYAGYELRFDSLGTPGVKPARRRAR